jgi:hypothetical protein
MAVCLNQPANSLPLIEALGAFENFLFFSVYIDFDETGKADLRQKALVLLFPMVLTAAAQ